MFKLHFDLLRRELNIILFFYLDIYKDKNEILKINIIKSWFLYNPLNQVKMRDVSVLKKDKNKIIKINYNKNI